MENRGLTGRSAWTALDDGALVSQCAVDLYRASGPGGQKRNKTSSAVRLRHLRPSALRSSPQNIDGGHSASEAQPFVQ